MSQEVRTKFDAPRIFAFAILLLCVLAFQGRAQAASSDEPGEWKAGIAYPQGTTVTYLGNLYESLSTHQSQTDWLPTEASSLWKKVDLLSYVHIGGRVVLAGEGVNYSWPGIYFSARFKGTGIGIKLEDPTNRYKVEIDGASYPSITAPGNVTQWFHGLKEGEHTIRLTKVSETYWSYGRFEGFVPVEGGTLLSPPAYAARQIEFIGDSFTAGFGTLSNQRECSQDQIAATTDASQTFGAFTALQFGAEYQINGLSGRGMVRNYGGTDIEHPYPVLYNRDLINDPTSVTAPNASWKPQIVVIELGINDLSPLEAGESYTAETLKQAYQKAYNNFIATLRTKYGSNVDIIVSATPLWPDNLFQKYTQEIVTAQRAAGDQRIHYFSFEGITLNGCLWHPTVSDHHQISAQLNQFINALPSAWNRIPKEAMVWSDHTTYQLNDIVVYNGIIYSNIKAHTSNVGWNPASSPTLWKKVVSQ
ncbi:lysophospholipase L1-like esterase [Paenibacillus shirakamiensis]|uniref:Lysophospholipase L1-like esterase n=1 Tax=Paenibacillus shirakamiensis TaxID=1265935 RepID=A0ABS4JJT6_9BACL|nr:carbohydrate-binding protein [Paenibacillus shirakamiensis]MBP2001251.1 lysophospholipase L1-like esterase [Paenibacillus shirakamiensis]